ncbi:nuclear transport factor 2 family protein [Legionella sp. D16C41]|uniref:nuclear transport factor 2 family protein n=1 Tax=Legionella sp. D16C41 TaxID=3402688 RepID=UPI003AF7D9F8
MRAISNLLFKFATSFDVKDWQGVEDTLADNIVCNYQDLRGEIKTYSKAEYVNSRAEVLNNLYTQHFFSNLEIDYHRNEAYCRLSAIIYRRDKEGSYFNSHVIYNFKLTKKSKNWKIKEIKQTVLWNEGDSIIHKGV